MQQSYRGDIQGIELRQAEAQRRRPVGACAPARALQHEAHAMLDGQFQVGPEIILQRLPPSFGPQERDRREEGKNEAAIEDHLRFEPRIAEKQSVELRRSEENTAELPTL